MDISVMQNHENSLRTEVSNVKSSPDGYGNRETACLSSSQDRSDENSCLTLSESGKNIHLKNHTEDIEDTKGNILEKEVSTKVHEVTSISEVTEEMFQDEKKRESMLEGEKTKQECEPSCNTDNEIPTGQIKESASAPSKHNPETTDSEESIKVISHETACDKVEKSTDPLSERLGHEAVLGDEQDIKFGPEEARGGESTDEVEGLGIISADSETSDISVTSNLKDECSPGVNTNPLVKCIVRETMMHVEDGEQEAEGCQSLFKEQSVEKTSMKEIYKNATQVEESEKIPEPNLVSMSLFEKKEITKTTDEVPSMNPPLSSHTDVSAEEITSEEMDEEFVILKENNISSATDDTSAAEISHEANDFKMTSTDLLSTTIIDTANAKEESSASFVSISLREAMGHEGDGKEQAEDFSLDSSEKTLQNTNSSEDKASHSKSLEHNLEMMSSSEELETKEYWDKGQNKSSTTALPDDGTTSAEVSGKFEKSYDYPLEVPKDEDAKNELLQNVPSTLIATEVVGEAILYHKAEKHKIDSDKSVLSNEATVGNASFDKAKEFDNKSVKQGSEISVASEKVETKEARDESACRDVHVLTASERSNEEHKFVETKDALKTTCVALLEAPIHEHIMSDDENKDFSQEAISAASGSAKAQKAETPSSCSAPTNNTHITNQRYESVSDVGHCASIVKKELVEVVAYNEDGKQQLEVSNVVFNEQIFENADSEEITMSEKQSEFLAYKQVSLAEKLPMEEREVTKTTEYENDEFAKFETSQNDQDKEMEVSYLPVSQFLIDRITREEDDKSLIMIQEENTEHGCKGVDNMKQGLDLSSDKHTRVEECTSQNTTEVPKSCDAQEFAYNIDEEPNSNVSSLPAMETLVKDAKEEVVMSENLTDVVPKDVKKHEMSEKSETQSDLKNGEFIGPGLMTNEKSNDADEVTKQKGTLNDNGALTKNPDTPSAAKTDSNKVLQEEGCQKFVEAKEIRPSIEMLEKTTIEDHPPETMAIIETKNFIGIDETRLNTQEPRPVLEIKQVLGDVLEFPPKEKEVKTRIDDKHDGITNTQSDSIVEDPIERTQLSYSGKGRPSGSGKDSMDDINQNADDTLEEKSLAINRDEVKAEAIDMQVDDDKSDEEDGKNEEHEIDKSGTDAPATVEIRDEEPKTAHKKSHNILSGVKSKVKHSLAKVKKAITGKSSHSKTIPPK